MKKKVNYPKPRGKCAKKKLKKKKVMKQKKY